MLVAGPVFSGRGLAEYSSVELQTVVLASLDVVVRPLPPLGGSGLSRQVKRHSATIVGCVLCLERSKELVVPTDRSQRQLLPDLKRSSNETVRMVTLDVTCRYIGGVISANVLGPPFSPCCNAYQETRVRTGRDVCTYYLTSVEDFCIDEAREGKWQ